MANYVKKQVKMMMIIILWKVLVLSRHGVPACWISASGHFQISITVVIFWNVRYNYQNIATKTLKRKKSVDTMRKSPLADTQYRLVLICDRYSITCLLLANYVKKQVKMMMIIILWKVLVLSRHWVAACWVSACGHFHISRTVVIFWNVRYNYQNIATKT